MDAETTAGTAVEWMGWGPEIFRRADGEDKLILLDSGATDRKSTRLNSSHYS